MQAPEYCVCGVATIDGQEVPCLRVHAKAWGAGALCDATLECLLWAERSSRDAASEVAEVECWFRLVGTSYQIACRWRSAAGTAWHAKPEWCACIRLMPTDQAQRTEAEQLLMEFVSQAPASDSVAHNDSSDATRVQTANLVAHNDSSDVTRVQTATSVAHNDPSADSSDVTGVSAATSVVRVDFRQSTAPEPVTDTIGVAAARASVVPNEARKSGKPTASSAVRAAPLSMRTATATRVPVGGAAYARCGGAAYPRSGAQVAKAQTSAATDGRMSRTAAIGARPPVGAPATVAATRRRPRPTVVPPPQSPASPDQVPLPLACAPVASSAETTVRPTPRSRRARRPAASTRLALGWVPNDRSRPALSLPVEADSLFPPSSALCDDDDLRVCIMDHGAVLLEPTHRAPPCLNLDALMCSACQDSGRLVDSASSQLSRRVFVT